MPTTANAWQVRFQIDIILFRYVLSIFGLDSLNFILFNIVLVSPEIPPNTGNIIRLCANTGCNLHLVEPLGFELSDAKLRRAGLDYREWANVQVYESYSSFVERHDSERLFIYSKFHSKLYTESEYHPGDVFVFGSETAGLPESIRMSVNSERCLKLPMLPYNRSINLSNAVAIVVFEAWRQNGFVFSNN